MPRPTLPSPSSPLAQDAADRRLDARRLVEESRRLVVLARDTQDIAVVVRAESLAALTNADHAARIRAAFRGRYRRPDRPVVE